MVVENSPNTNQFKVTAGTGFISGEIISLSNDAIITGLTTPGAPRVDEVYLEVREIERTDGDYPDIGNAAIGQTTTRLQLIASVQVSEGGVTPASTGELHAGGIQRIHIATLNRDANNTVISAEITDTRPLTGLTVPEGGTGTSSFDDGAILVGGGGAAPLEQVDPDTLGKILKDNGPGNNPSYEDIHTVLNTYQPAFLPTGVVMPFAGSISPSGWLICDGTAVSRTTYATLFATVSTTYGVGDGSTTFNVPDLRGRAIIGKDDMGVGSANRVVNAQADILGGSMGEENHTLSSSEMPNHTHSLSVSGSGTTSTTVDHTHIQQFPYDPGNADVRTAFAADTGSGVPGGLAGANFDTTAGATKLTTQGGGSDHTHTYSVTSTGTSGTAGSGTAHNNMQPSMALNYIIKAA